MKIGERAKTVILTSFMVFFTIGLLFTLLSQTGTVANLVVGCEGIENYYTGEGFMSDYATLIFRTTNSGRYNNTNGMITSYILRTPKEMSEGMLYDCKSISNAIYCLGRLYNRSCRFRNEIKINSDLTFAPGHLGISCWRDEPYGWDVLY